MMLEKLKILNNFQHSKDHFITILRNVFQLTFRLFLLMQLIPQEVYFSPVNAV